MLVTNDDMKVNLLSDGLSDSSCNLNVKITKKKAQTVWAAVDSVLASADALRLNYNCKKEENFF